MGFFLNNRYNIAIGVRKNKKTMQRIMRDMTAPIFSPIHIHVSVIRVSRNGDTIPAKKTIPVAAIR
jgi:hypothetical protein